MAVDTRDRRSSLIGLGLPVPRLLPTPGGSLSNIGDRLQLTQLYRRIEDALSAALEGLESQSSPASAAQEEMESQSSSVETALGYLESQSSSTAASAVGLESNEVGGPGSYSVPMEELGFSTAESALAAETLRQLGLTAYLAFESHYPTSIQTAVLAVEAAQGVSSTLIVAAPIGWESVRSLVIETSISVESKRATSLFVMVPWEFVVFFSLQSVGLIETARYLTLEGQARVETSLRARQDFQGPLESLWAPIGQGATGIEIANLVGSAQAVAQTGTGNLDVLRALQAAAGAPTEGRRLLILTAAVQVERAVRRESTGDQAAESVGLLVTEAQGAVEAAQDSGAGQAEIQLEAEMDLRASGVIQWSHSEDEQPPDHLRISGRGALIIQKDQQATLIVAKGS